ncbi:MAG: helix-turn-helix domain-containing protein [Eggerthellaceae bacterium]
MAGETRTVDAHIQTLRKKIGEIDQEAASLIETVRGVGYRMKG